MPCSRYSSKCINLFFKRSGRFVALNDILLSWTEVENGFSDWKVGLIELKLLFLKKYPYMTSVMNCYYTDKVI